MQLFHRNRREANSQESLGAWPIRLRLFELVSDFEFTRREQPELFFVTAGRAVLETDSGPNRQPVTEGSAVILPPGQRFSLTSVHDLRITALRILPEYFSTDAQALYSLKETTALWAAMFFFGNARKLPQPETFHLHPPESLAISSDLAVVQSELREGGVSSSQSQLTHLAVLKLLFHLARQRAQFWRDRPLPELPPDLVIVIEFLENLIAHGVRMNLRQIAQSCNQRPPVMEKSFKDHLDLEPMAYLENRRAQQAARLVLTTRLSHKAIAERVGFANTAGLESHFKDLFGRSPDQYRVDFASE